MTLIEVLVAGGIVAVALVPLSHTLLASEKVREINRERYIAELAAHRTLTTLRASTFSSVFTEYQGEGFPVPGLEIQESDFDGMPGEIHFPTSKKGALVENIDDPTLGMPFDLNGDGTIDGNDHAGDYLLLPVVVRVRWQGSLGDRQIEIISVLVDRS